MKIGVFIRRKSLREKTEYKDMVKQLLDASYELYDIESKADIRPDTDLVLSVGGDGTFLSAAHVVSDVGLPILGVNFGRIGFLCENRPGEVLDALMQGDFRIEYRTVLNATIKGPNARKQIGFLPYAVNEVSLHRIGSAVLGIDVAINGEMLPTYWADGLIIATSSGSTAYSLSVGGPICLPDTKVLIIAPIAPHNLNVRPLVVPEGTKLDISFRSRDGKATMTMDNTSVEIEPDWAVHIEMAQFSLKRVKLPKSEFVAALTSRLFWGEDRRNNGLA
ncbi:MAG: NAD(+)/NADH kinase [Bacteroidales bacterium]|jgi:NAD+ kinase|nr:NAD(+)/NADH kinase [Bacteroidales bacterium]